MTRSAADYLSAACAALETDQDQLAFFDLQECLTRARTEGDNRVVAEALITLGENALRFPLPQDMDAWQWRKQWCAEAREIFKTLGDYRGIIRCLIVEGIDAASDRAGPLLEQALALSHHHRIADGEINSLCGLAMIQAVDGDKELANSLNFKALQLARRELNDRAILRCLEQRAIMLAGNYEECVLAFDELFGLCRLRHLNRRLADNLLIFATVACDDEHLDRKEASLLESLAISRAEEDVERQARALDALIEMYESQGDEVHVTELVQLRNLLPQT